MERVYFCIGKTISGCFIRHFYPFRLASGIILLGILCAIATTVVGQESKQKQIAQTQMGFLAIPDGARYTGMGSAAVSIAEGIEATFINPAGLKNIGHNLYQRTPASGEYTFGNPATEGFGSVEQMYLETSNVDVVEEMVNMIVAQRAYEINSKVIKTADDMMALTNRLKG